MVDHKYRRTYYETPEGYFTATDLTENTDLNENNLLQTLHMARQDDYLEKYLKVKPPSQGAGAPRRAFEVEELLEWLENQDLKTDFRENLISALKDRRQDKAEKVN